MYVHARKHRYIHTHVVEWYNVAKPIECLKLQVISNKRATHYRALLRKMTHKDEASSRSLPPYDYSLCVRLIPLHDMYSGNYGGSSARNAHPYMTCIHTYLTCIHPYMTCIHTYINTHRSGNYGRSSACDVAQALYPGNWRYHLCTHTHHMNRTHQ